MSRFVVQHVRNGDSCGKRLQSLASYHQLESGISAHFSSLLNMKYDKNSGKATKEKARNLVAMTKVHGKPIKEQRVNEMIDDTIAMGMSTGEAREMMIEELSAEFETND